MTTITRPGPTNLQNEPGYELDLLWDQMADVVEATEVVANAALPAATAATTYAPIAKGVTNGDSHNHDGGDGGQIAYSVLSGLPTLGTAAALNVGTAASNVVQLNGSAQLPAVDGSLLTNLPGGGVTDHGALTGLSDDDHSQYHTDARGDARYAPLAHANSTANPHSVTAAQAGADATGTAAAAVSAHAGGTSVHAIASITGLETVLSGKSPTSHDHAATYAPIANGVTNGDSHDHSGGDGAQIAYSTLSGLPTLGTAAATAATDYAAASHAHAASAITSGTIDTARLGSGTANSSTYLRGDQTWAAASGGVAADTHAATEKTTPVDADELPLADSAASWALKKLSWANLKTTLSGVFALLAGKSGGQTLIGGTGVTDKLTLQGTSGNGTVTSTALEFKVGNNGSTNALTILNDGKIGINKTEPIYQFSVSRGATAGIVSTFESSGSYTAVQIVSGSGSVNLVGSGSSLAMQCGGIEIMRLSHVNNSVGIGISTPSAKLHSLATTEQLRLGYDASNYTRFTVGSTGTLTITPSNNKIILGSTRTPASASATGNGGEVCWDSDYIYVCTASNTWKRAALSTW